jgi:hypothetical protein
VGEGGMIWMRRKRRGMIILPRGGFLLMRMTMEIGSMFSMRIIWNILRRDPGEDVDWLTMRMTLRIVIRMTNIIIVVRCGND